MIFFKKGDTGRRKATRIDGKEQAETKTLCYNISCKNATGATECGGLPFFYTRVYEQEVVHLIVIDKDNSLPATTISRKRVNQ